MAAGFAAAETEVLRDDPVTEEVKKDGLDEMWDILIEDEGTVESKLNPGEDRNVIDEAFDKVYEEEEYIFEQLDPESGNFGEEEQDKEYAREKEN